MTSSTSLREPEEEAVLQITQEGIFQFTAAARACWGWWYGLCKSLSLKQTAILFLKTPPQLYVEEPGKPAIFCSSILTHFPRLSLWALQAWRALASYYCSGCSILLWTLSLGSDHKNHVSGPQWRICCTVYNSLLQEQKTQSYFNSCIWYSSQLLRPREDSLKAHDQPLPSLLVVPATLLLHDHHQCASILSAHAMLSTPISYASQLP